MTLEALASFGTPEPPKKPLIVEYFCKTREALYG